MTALEKNHELFLANSINSTESLLLLPRHFLASRIWILANRHQNLDQTILRTCRFFFPISRTGGAISVEWQMKEENWRDNKLNEQIENISLMDYDVVASRDRDVNHGDDACDNENLCENSSVCVRVCMWAYMWTGMLNRIHRLHVLSEWGWCVKSIYAPVRHIIFHDVKHRIFRLVVYSVEVYT